MNLLEFQNLTKRNPANIASNFSLIASSLKQEKNTKIAEKQIDLCALKNPETMKTKFLTKQTKWSTISFQRKKSALLYHIYLTSY